MNRADYNNTITEQVMDIASLALVQVEKCFDLEKLKQALPEDVASGLCRAVFVGCGDSYSAAGAMSLGFRKLSGIRSVAVPDIMDFDYFYRDRDLTKEFSPDQVLFVAVSASGGSQSIVDALGKAAEIGAHTLLITNNPESASAKAARYVYNVQTPAGLNTPGLRSYFASMIGILALGAYIGVCRGISGEEKFSGVGEQIRAYIYAFMKDIDRIDEQMFDVAVKMKDLRKFEITADWNDTYSAQFVEQKIYECTGTYAVHTNSEEWVHIGVMMRNPEEVGSVFMTSCKDRSFPRMIDTIYMAYALERPILIVSDAEDETPFAEFPEADVCLVHGAPESFLSPLADFIPGSLLAGYHAALNGLNFFGGRYDYREKRWLDR